MYEIKNSQGTGEAIDGLLNSIIEISQSHKNEKQAFAFALIVYDFYDPHIDKILNDEKYFNALDYLSGNILTVFYINSEYLSHQSQKAMESNRVRMEFGVQKLDGPVNVSPKFIAEKLINKETLPSPSVLFFNVSNNLISDFTIAQLRKNEVEKGFNELLSLIEEAVDSLKNVKEEYRNNESEIFNLLKSSIESSEFWKNSRSGFQKLMKMKDFLLFWKV